MVAGDKGEGVAAGVLPGAQALNNKASMGSHQRVFQSRMRYLLPRGENRFRMLSIDDSGWKEKRVWPYAKPGGSVGVSVAKPPKSQHQSLWVVSARKFRRHVAGGGAAFAPERQSKQMEEGAEKPLEREPDQIEATIQIEETPGDPGEGAGEQALDPGGMGVNQGQHNGAQVDGETGQFVEFEVGKFGQQKLNAKVQDQ